GNPLDSRQSFAFPQIMTYVCVSSTFWGEGEDKHGPDGKEGSVVRPNFFSPLPQPLASARGFFLYIVRQSVLGPSGQQLAGPFAKAQQAAGPTDRALARGIPA